MAYTEGSKIQGSGRNLYTQKFRAQVRILVVGVYSILEFFGAGKAPDLERIQKARKVQAWADLYTQIFRVWSGSWSGAYTESLKSRARAESVYSNFQSPGRFPVDSVYRSLKKPEPWAEPVYSNFQNPGRFLVDSVYK